MKEHARMQSAPQKLFGAKHASGKLEDQMRSNQVKNFCQSSRSADSMRTISSRARRQIIRVN